ncbi:MAG: hypothetical protein WCF23_24380 [Candidatus Nitrosopolaris sp.]
MRNAIIYLPNQPENFKVGYYDLLILDIKMSEINGFSAACCFRFRKPAAYILGLGLRAPHGGWDEIGTCVVTCWPLAAILTILFPPNRRSLFTMWLLLPAVPLVLLPAVLFALFGHGEWLLNGTCVGLSFPTLLLFPVAVRWQLKRKSRLRRR